MSAQGSPLMQKQDNKGIPPGRPSLGPGDANRSPPNGPKHRVGALAQATWRGGMPPQSRYRIPSRAQAAPQGQGPAANIHHPIKGESTPGLPVENSTTFSDLPSKAQIMTPSSSLTRPNSKENVGVSQVDRKPPKNTRPAITEEKRASTLKGMAASDCSDEIVLTKFKGNQGASGPRNRDKRWQSSRWSQRNVSSNPSSNTDENKGRQRNVRQPNTEARARNITAGGSPRQPNSPLSRGNAFKVAPPEALEELKQLQKEVVVQAHLNRHKEHDVPEAHPKFLATIRDGPGTDPNSEIYREIEQRRQTPGWRSEMESVRYTKGTFPTVDHPDVDIGSESGDLDFEESVKEVPPEKYKAQWTLYMDSPRAYPKVENDEVLLSSEPTPGHVYTPTQPKGSGLEPTPVPHVSRPQVLSGDNHWTDAFFADWNYHPKGYHSIDAFRDRFYHWLDSTLQICCRVDIYHQAFFNGTAHSDGERSLFVPDIESPAVTLDQENEKNRLHTHETAEGYCYNLQHHMKNDEQAVETKRKAAREAYLQAAKTAPSPDVKSPSANIYLRPVENDDVPGLLEIYNWYVRNSTLKSEIDSLGEEDMRQRIEGCKRERLPFLVAAERRTGLTPRDPDHSNTRERIFGYALAADFVGQRTTGRFTAQVEIFVKDDEKRRGIGRSFIDKLLEVCDAAYNPKKGYFFDSSGPGYFPGGRRKLVRLVFVYSYPSNESSEYKRITEWLKRYQFKEQGLLLGIGVKFDKFLNTSYLVRDVGPSDEWIFSR